MTTERGKFLPGDVYLTASDTAVGRLIRFCTRSKGEEKTLVNHVGVVVGTMDDDAAIVEALVKGVKVGRISKYDDGRTLIAVYRPINLTAEEIRKVTARACASVGKRYGFVKILVRGLDWAFGAKGRVSRMMFLKHIEDCGWLVAHAFKAAGKDFGISAKAATPDDIHDFVRGHPDKYECIKPLGTM